MNNNKHTPTSWAIDLRKYIVSRDGTVAVCCYDANIGEQTMEANATFIVRAVNCHEPLLQAVKLVLAIHDHPEHQAPQWRINLDPMALKQLRATVAFAEKGNGHVR